MRNPANRAPLKRQSHIPGLSECGFSLAFRLPELNLNADSCWFSSDTWLSRSERIASLKIQGCTTKLPQTIFHILGSATRRAEIPQCTE